MTGGESAGRLLDGKLNTSLGLLPLAVGDLIEIQQIQSKYLVLNISNQIIFTWQVTIGYQTSGPVELQTNYFDRQPIRHQQVEDEEVDRVNPLEDLKHVMDSILYPTVAESLLKVMLVECSVVVVFAAVVGSLPWAGVEVEALAAVEVD